jgi:CRP/FNR family transcriptional regulator, dissimilatory nitrate respiration regulator
MQERDISTAQQSSLLAGLPQDVTSAILASAVTQTYGRGETLFLQGEPARTLRIVLEGWVKLYRTAPNGGEAVIGVFTGGQSFGEAVVLSGGAYPVTAEAVTDCRVMQVDACVFLELFRRRPEIVGSILGAMYAQLHTLVTEIEQLKARTGAQRLAEFLLQLCPVESGGCAVRLPYDKTLIAGRLGMKPESLSRGFNRLRKVGVAVTHSNAAIADVERLRRFAEEDPALAWSGNNERPA